jgi:hypothetical protein
MAEDYYPFLKSVWFINPWLCIQRSIRDKAASIQNYKPVFPSLNLHIYQICHHSANILKSQVTNNPTFVDKHNFTTSLTKTLFSLNTESHLHNSIKRYVTSTNIHFGVKDWKFWNHQYSFSWKKKKCTTAFIITHTICQNLQLYSEA